MRFNQFNRQSVRIAMMLGILAIVLPQTEAVIVGVKSFGSDSSPYPGPARLFSFNEDGSALTDLAEIRVSGSGGINVNAMAWSSIHGIFAYRWNGTSQLIQLSTNGPNFNISGGIVTATPVGVPLPGIRIMGATFDLNDRLWVVDNQRRLYQIDPTTGAIIGLPVQITGTSVSDAVGDLAVRQDGTMYVTVYAGNYYTVNPTTGVATLKFQETSAVPDYRFNMGMTFSGGNSNSNYLYAFEGNGPDDLLRYDLSASPVISSRTVLAAGVLPPDNPPSYSSDLAGLLIPEPTCVMLATLGGLLLLRRRKA